MPPASIQTGVFVCGVVLGAAPLMAQPAAPATNETIFFYHPDHLGSTNAVTDAEGRLVSEFYNYPFGQPRHAYHEIGGADPYYQFTDKERDAESSLHYFEARFYDALAGRFVQVDPFRVEKNDPASPAKLNVYAYALNRPMVMIDPTGLDPFGLSDKISKVSTWVSTTVGAAQAAAEVHVEKLSNEVKLFSYLRNSAGTIVTEYDGALAAAKGAFEKGPAKVSGVLKTFGTVVGVVTTGVSLGLTAVAIDDRVSGRTDESSAIVGGVADTTAGAVGIFGGPVGLAGSVGYGGGTLAAEQIDKNTSWYNRVVKNANEVADVMRAGGASETETSIIGSLAAGAESIGISFNGIRDALSQPRDPDDP